MLFVVYFSFFNFVICWDLFFIFNKYSLSYLIFIRNFVFFCSRRSPKLHKLHAPQNVEPPLDFRPVLLIILGDKGALEQGSLRVLMYFPVSIIASMVDTQVSFIYHLRYIQGGSNMTGTDLCVNKPHCAAAVRP